MEDCEVLIQVQAAGVCGFDIPRIYKMSAHPHQLIPGHEFAGIVESHDPHFTQNLGFTVFCSVVLLFLCINGDHRIACVKVLFCQNDDDPKLIVMARARLANLQHFRVHLLTVPHICEQPRQFDITDLYPVFIKRDSLDFSEAHALRSPVEHFWGSL